jgi:malate dehydrogenase (oxaloacetate-decarboxylating)(NADP+)
MQRRGVTPTDARRVLRTSSTEIAAMLVRRGEADAMICSLTGKYSQYLRHLEEVLEVAEGTARAGANMLVLRKDIFVFPDIQMHAVPDAPTLARTALAVVERAWRFGTMPSVVLPSHSNFGSSDASSGPRVCVTLAEIRRLAPDLAIDGEMQADAAPLDAVRKTAVSDSSLHGAANVLIMPTLDAANIAMRLLTGLGEGITVGPTLTGLCHAANVLPPSSSVRRAVNMSALAAVDRQQA